MRTVVMCGAGPPDDLAALELLSAMFLCPEPCASAAVALAEAQRPMLADGRDAHPRHWAARAIGDPRTRLWP